ncbi:MAG: DUF7507 domain-containing protein [Rhodoglobus sp.]
MTDSTTMRGALAQRSTPRRWLAIALTTVMALAGVTVSATAANAATGSVTNPTISVVSDGMSTTSPVLDDNENNGIVGTNDRVCFNWTFSSSGVVDGLFQQTLPAGWTWDETSLGTLTSSSSLYTSSYTIVDQTLTATVNVPVGSSIVTLGALCAVPTSAAVPGEYTPTLVVTDGVGETTVTAPPVTVVGTPKTDVVKALAASQRFADHDFGNGQESAVFIDFAITIQRPLGTERFGATDTVFPDPFTITDQLTSAVAPDIELLGPSSGTVALSGASDILVTGATGVGTTPWSVTVRLWYKSSELPTAVDNPSSLPLTNTATVAGIVDDNTANNTATATVQAPDPTGVGPATGKDIYVANDPAAPVFNVDPADTAQAKTTPVTNGFVATASIVYSRFYQSLRYTSSGAIAPLVNPVNYDFWDPTTQQIFGDNGDIYVGDSVGSQLPSAEFDVLYTNDDGSGAVDPTTLTWFPRSDSRFSPSTVSGISVRYLGDGSPNPSWDKAWFLTSVPFTIVAGTAVTVNDIAKFTVDGSSPSSWARFVIVTANQLTMTKAVSVPSTTSGSSFTYTLQPNVDRAPGVTDEAAVTGLKVTDTLPSSIVSVDTSSVSPEWSTAVTPGDPGPDGVPGTSDDVSGITLVFTYLPHGGVATTDAVLAPITYGVTSSLLRPATGTIVNTAIISADENAQSDASRTATATVTIAQANVLAKNKVADDPQIEVRDPQVSWTSAWYNFRTVAQDQTYFVDVLPYNGDGRGTDFSGTATLASATLVGLGAAGSSLEYTTAAPASVSDAPASAVTWIAAPANGDFTGITGVTALRTSVPVFLNGENGVGGLKVALTVSGQVEGDVYANSLTGIVNADSNTPLLFPNGDPALVTVVGSSISGLVWHDVNGDGLSAGEAGIPGVLVSLFDASGAPVLELDGVTPVTTTTALDGTYTFEGYHSGDYIARVAPPTIAQHTTVNTYDNDGDLDSDSGVVTVGVDADLLNVDFGYRYELIAAPAIDVTKSGSIDGPGAGSTVTWTITATNTGNVKLTDVNFVDELEGLSDLSYVWPADAGVLEVGEVVTVTGTYVTTEADLIAGKVVNVVVGHGTGTDGTEVEDTATAEVPLTEQATPAIDVTKRGSVDGPGVGATVTWTITATNTGNITLTDVNFVDELEGLSDLSYTWPADAGVLKAGEVVTVTGTYITTAADLAAGKVVNVVVGSGTGTDGTEVEDTATAEVPVLAVPTPGIDVTKTGSISGKGVGATVTWTITATNTGNVTLTDVTLDDELKGLSELTYTWPGEEGVLKSGDVVTVTGTYQTTAADVLAGKVVNVVVGTGTAPDGTDVEDTATAEVPVLPLPVTPPTTVAKPTGLAFTGAVTMPIMGIALMLLMAGAVTMIVRRRKASE